jgi:hypothetical protein
MTTLVWQLFDHPAGRVAVPAADAEGARIILAREAWNKTAPSWPWTGTITVPRPPWSPWERLAAFAAGEVSRADGSKS